MYPPMPPGVFNDSASWILFHWLAITTLEAGIGVRLHLPTKSLLDSDTRTSPAACFLWILTPQNELQSRRYRCPSLSAMGTCVVTQSRRYSCKYGTLSFFRFDGWAFVPVLAVLDDDVGCVEFVEDDEDEATLRVNIDASPPARPGGTAPTGEWLVHTNIRAARAKRWKIAMAIAFYLAA